MTMNEKNCEQLSVFMDDEQERGIANDLIVDKTCRQTWMRYHLIRDVMQQTLPSDSCLDIADRVAAHIEQNEPAILAPVFRRKDYLKPVAGFAIAASVAMVAVFGIQKHNLQQPDSITTPIASEYNVALEPINLASLPKARQYAPAIRQVSLEQSQQGLNKSASLHSGFNPYMINYNEYHARVGVQGMLPYVRIVSSDVSE